MFRPNTSINDLFHDYYEYEDHRQPYADGYALG